MEDRLLYLFGILGCDRFAMFEFCSYFRVFILCHKMTLCVCFWFAYIIPQNCSVIWCSRRHCNKQLLYFDRVNWTKFEDRFFFLLLWLVVFCRWHKKTTLQKHSFFLLTLEDNFGSHTRTRFHNSEYYIHTRSGRDDRSLREQLTRTYIHTKSAVQAKQAAHKARWYTTAAATAAMTASRQQQQKQREQTIFVDDKRTTIQTIIRIP